MWRGSCFRADRAGPAIARWRSRLPGQRWPPQGSANIGDGKKGWRVFSLLVLAAGGAVQELADQFFEYDGALRVLNGISLGQHFIVTTGCHADVLLPQQARGQDRHR